MIIVKDNLIAPGIIDYLLDATISKSFPWYFLPDSAFVGDITKNKGDNYSFVHMVSVGNKNLSSLADVVRVAVLDIQDKTGFTRYNIGRMRLALQTTMGKEIINPPHIDEPTFEHKSCILYLNDSDGDTCFFKNDKQTIYKRVAPKKGRIVLFDGNIYHASSKPINNQYRVILNINFIEKSKWKDYCETLR